MNYLDTPQNIARVTENDEVVGMVERWQAHRENLLHRAFTVTIWYKDTVFLQHRKHPVFDHVLDATISSHQLYVDGKIEPTIDAVYRALEREWYITKEDLIDVPRFDGSVYYQAQDPGTIYVEHEVCHVYGAHIRTLKEANLEYAYGYERIGKAALYDRTNPLHDRLAPWVHAMLKQNLI